MVDRPPYDSRGVANYILDERERFGLKTTHLELQKLIYFCHGLTLVRSHCPLVDGYFEAWDHGPVHPHLYQLFKQCGADSIDFRCEGRNLITGQVKVVEPPSSNEVKQQLSEVVLQLRSLSASQLRAKSHATGGPWHYVRASANTELASRVRIPDNVIRERYFRHMSSVGDALRGSEHDEDNSIEPYRSREQWS